MDLVMGEAPQTREPLKVRIIDLADHPASEGDVATRLPVMLVYVRIKEVRGNLQRY